MKSHLFKFAVNTQYKGKCKKYPLIVEYKKLRLEDFLCPTTLTNP
jgi:hypothetical protein